MSHRKHIAEHGPVSRRLSNGRQFDWSPQGPIVVIVVDERGRGAREPAGHREDFGAGGLTARLFVGLFVGDKLTYTVDNVIEATRDYRASHGQSVDSSFIAQKGLYTGRTGVVQEDSVQVIVFDVSGASEATFEQQMEGLAKTLRAKFDQDAVYVEMQQSGTVLKFFSIERPKT